MASTATTGDAPPTMMAETAKRSERKPVSMWIWLAGDTGPLALIALGIHFLPVPYNIVFAVGAWRSAADPRHFPATRLWSRVFAIALAALYMVI